MKKVKQVILLLIFSLPFMVNAATGKMFLECDNSKITLGSEFTCKVKGESDDIVTSLSALVSLDEGVTIKSFDPVGFSGDSIHNNTINVYNGKSKGTFDIGNLVLSVANDDTLKDKNQLTLGLTNIKFNDSKFQPYTVESFEMKLNIVKEEEKKGLKLIKLNNVMLDLAGNSKGITYSGDDYREIILDVETYEADSNIIIYRDKDKKTFAINTPIKFLGNSEGQMLLEIYNNAVEKSNLLYTILVVPKVIEYDNSLKELYIGDKKVDLGSNKDDEYVVFLDSIKDGYTVKAEVSDSEHFKIDPYNGGVGVHHSSNLILEVVPIDSNLGLKSRIYKIKIDFPPEPETETGTGSGTSTSTEETQPSTDSNEPIGGNPPTGNISIFIITVLIISSLVASLVIYKKNIEYYNN